MGSDRLTESFHCPVSRGQVALAYASPDGQHFGTVHFDLDPDLVPRTEDGGTDVDRFMAGYMKPAVEAMLEKIRRDADRTIEVNAATTAGKEARKIVLRAIEDHTHIGSGSGSRPRVVGFDASADAVVERLIAAGLIVQE